MLVKILDSQSFLFKGKVWMTNTKYIESAGCSPKSTKVPYDHVKVGKATMMTLMGRTFFSSDLLNLANSTEDEFFVDIQNDDVFLYGDVAWYTLPAYLNLVRAGVMSTKVPYDHVESGKAIKMDILGRVFFSQVKEVENKEQ